MFIFIRYRCVFLFIYIISEGATVCVKVLGFIFLSLSFSIRTAVFKFVCIFPRPVNKPNEIITHILCQQSYDKYNRKREREREISGARFIGKCIYELAFDYFLIN